MLCKMLHSKILPLRKPILAKPVSRKQHVTLRISQAALSSPFGKGEKMNQPVLSSQ